MSSSGSGPKKSDDAPHGRPSAGTAGPGEDVDPMRIPDEGQSNENFRDKPQEAPGPGIPMSDAQYDWLKRKAKVVRTPPSKHRQDDPSTKKRK
jgi:hypothetical protein